MQPRIKLKLSAPAAPATAGQQSTGATAAASGGGGVSSNTPEKKKRGRKRNEFNPKTLPPTLPDSDEEYPTLVEEQVILRMPDGDPATERLRQLVESRSADIEEHLTMSWHDGRRGLLQLDGQVFLTRLVDLPCIIESQKTLDKKQFYKVADICQMVMVERPPPGFTMPPPPPPTTESFVDGRVVSVAADAQQTAQHLLSAIYKGTRPLATNEYTHNSGITPPLKYCRLRRFRRRINRRTVESIEKEVSRLLREDARALEVQTQFLDPAELETRLAAAEQEDDGAGGGEDETVNVDEFDDDERESQVDSDFAAELEDEISKAVAAMSSDDNDDEEEMEVSEDEEEEEEAAAAEDDEEEEEDAEIQALVDERKLVEEELRDIQDKIDEKTQQQSQAVNIIIQTRFQDIINKLKSEREIKRGQLSGLVARVDAMRSAPQPAAGGDENDDDEEEEDDAGDDVDVNGGEIEQGTVESAAEVEMADVPR